ncbi:alpha/beta hydrolase-fold protein [Thalassobellus sediminis]|uniref:carboxylesterase family protein n=1 Tax=Thalassobellus sediminis TaxID=3367753 RepID=UPI0037AD9183
MLKINYSIFIFVFFSASILFSQNKTGNIVEYFGKEKVNDIKEGKLLHIFKSAFILETKKLGFESSSFPKDPIFDKFLKDTKYKVKNNDVFDIDYLGNEMIWKSITTDSTNSFTGKNLKSSYIYFTYNSKNTKTVLFEASGHSLILINGLPHEGDHYDFGWNLIPLTLKKGINTFLLKVGRFPRIRARLIEPKTKVQFTTRDLTLPDILIEESNKYKGAIRIVNASENWVKNYTITSQFNGITLTSNIPSISPMSVRKVTFEIAAVSKDTKIGESQLNLQLNNEKKETIDFQDITLQIKSNHKHHKRTFVSNIDGSIQYYSVAPSSNDTLKNGALFLSVHGASVEAVNQANAYKQKDWGNIIAPTNRRPFGFAWEDWGRLDAIEVLANAKTIYNPDPKHIYLTGHSMGGHGTWYLGATYPDKFAAIAPCAGYPDLLLYRDGFLKQTLKMPDEDLFKLGMAPKTIERLKIDHIKTPVETIIERAGTPSRTLKLIRNYLHYGVYILHGEKDNVVPTYIAQDMRKRLGKFHNDYNYYEYPDGEHWYGNHSLDWDPIFNYFKWHSIKNDADIKTLEFYTGSPGVSSKSHFVTIHQQEIPFEISSFNFKKEKSYVLKTDNTTLIEIDFSKLRDTINSIDIDGAKFKVSNNTKAFFKKTDNIWTLTKAPSLQEKGPHRNGGFKDAFRNNVVFVYATKGSEIENEWYYNRAKFDAQTFWYRANGSVEIVKDVDFSIQKYTNRNVIIYGNKSNNTAWKKLLKGSPIQVKNNEIDFNGKKLKGNQWGMYFILPNKNSDYASIGVITATGEKGMKAAYMNHYLVNGSTFPDLLLFNDEVLTNGMTAVKCAGFFGNDWSVENGDFEWK